jgi:flagellar biosynthesis GTPase FlhF
MTDVSNGASRGQLFVGRTPREAIAQVRATLGRDAVILEQRQRNGQVEILASRDFPEPAPERPDAGRRVLRERLLALGFEPAFADGLSAAGSSREVPTLLAQSLRCAAPPSPLSGAYRFVGPPGAGKTTTIIKLLADRVLRYGNRGIVLVSTDDRRLAGCEQLALAGELLEVAYRECSEAELDGVLTEHRDKSLVLVDTAGISFGQGPARPAATADVLVMPAMWQPRALRRLHGQLGGQEFVGAALTHVDQIDLLGPVLSVLGEWGLPLLWISRGPELPDDLERATPELLVELALGGVDRLGMQTTFAYGA